MASDKPKKRKREKMSLRGFTSVAVHTETAVEFRETAAAAGVTQDALLRVLLEKTNKQGGQNEQGFH